jgi:hypothetical protein
MIEKDRVSIIQDDFLEEEDFVELRDMLFAPSFPWFFQQTIIYDDDDKEITPGFFCHTVFKDNLPNSPLFKSHIMPILGAMKVSIASKVIINLNWRLPKPFTSIFHTDSKQKEQMTAGWTTSILYMNTNNGHTGLENGEKIESVANRFVSFPGNIKHRIVSQTDEQQRILINFNYLKEPSN